ncbi:AAA family ATPase [Neofamilia massiliensis]|uniref:AAA family ATPase n=1 Tax=Neofamilia massiliensis TaxID=1673724 RepID=UPI0006BB7340|nr:AAA family ATPase [Neofamilia massiliensis]
MKNKNIDSIPSLREIQNLYEDALRKEAKATSDKSSTSLGEFFKNFRIEEDVDRSFSENDLLKKYKDYLTLNKSYQKKAIEELENLIAYEKFFLTVERKENQNLYASNFYGSSFQTRARIERINEYNKNLKELITSSPDAWEFYYQRQLLRDIENSNSNNLVDISYVLEAKKKIIESLKAGTPVYLVGHLGSGKTQLAREAAMEFSIENIIQDDLELEMNKWFLKNQNISEAEAIEKFAQLNKEKRTYYKEALARGSEKDLEKIYPYFISGSYNLTYEDMFVEKTLSLEKANSKESDIDLVDKVVDQYLTWLRSHEKDFKNLPYEKENLIKSKLWDSISEIFIARNSTYGTVVKKIEKEILLAVKNGRTVIIDELNTIAMENLIGLNDILQSKVGSMAYVTGLGPVKIKKGFGLIGTGNLSTDSVSYEGTQDLNPAFKSRFLTIEYNYVNQSTLGSLKNQTNPEKNELFRKVCF